MHKLNIVIKKAEKEKPVIKAETGWESPVGWWQVTTEGDDEGRTTKDIGEFYGHVAEIALSCENYAWKLTFAPILGRAKPRSRPRYTIKQNRKVPITLDVTSKTWDLTKDDLIRYVTQWLDCPEVIVSDCCYYAAVTLELKQA